MQKGSNSGSRSSGRHRCCCCGRFLQLLLCRPSSKTSSSATAAVVCTSSQILQKISSCSIRPNYRENRKRTVRALSHSILRTGSIRDTYCGYEQYRMPDNQCLISIGNNTEQPQSTADIAIRQCSPSVNTEIFMLDIVSRVAHVAVYVQQHKTPRYSEYLQSEQAVSNPRLPPVVVIKTTGRVFQPGIVPSRTSYLRVYLERRIIS